MIMSNSNKLIMQYEVEIAITTVRRIAMRLSADDATGLIMQLDERIKDCRYLTPPDAAIYSRDVCIVRVAAPINHQPTNDQ